MKRPDKTRNSDGSMKTIGQLIRANLTVLQYGRYLAAIQKGASHAS